MATVSGHLSRSVTKSFAVLNVRDNYRDYRNELVDVEKKLLSFCQECGINYDISKQDSIDERKVRYPGKSGSNYTYGEIDLDSMVEIFVSIQKHNNSDNILHRSGGIFYDLGSGSGMPVFMTALLHPKFSLCRGIEMLNSLYRLSIKGKQALERMLEGRGSGSVEDSDNLHDNHPVIDFQLASITDTEKVDWTDGDIVFANSTCFDDSLLDAVERIARGMRPGSYIVMLSRQLADSHFSLVQELRLTMSWGMADVFIHMRKDAMPDGDLDQMEEAQLLPSLRIVCVSDTHGLHRQMPDIPPGDVLIHAGDFTNSGEPDQVADFMEWMHAQPHRHKLFIAGNHDLTVHSDYYEARGRDRFHHHLKVRYNVATVRDCLKKYEDVIYLEDSTADLVISVGGGKEVTLRVYGSPWQPTFFDWAYNLDRGEPIRQKWRLIPSNTDILITHGPPQGYGDRCMNGYRAGCADLLEEVEQRVRPRLHIFGHIHEDAGVWSGGVPKSDEAVSGDGSSADILYVNACTCDYNYNPRNVATIISFPLSRVAVPFRMFE